MRFIDYSAFKGVAARFAVDPDNEFYCSENGHLYDKAKSELIKGFYRQAKVEDIADTVEYIRTNSFYYAYGLSEVATEIILPENVFIVEYQAILCLRHRQSICRRRYRNIGRTLCLCR